MIIARGLGKNNALTLRFRPRELILIVWALSVVFLLLHVLDYFQEFFKVDFLISLFLFITPKITCYSLRRL